MSTILTCPTCGALAKVPAGAATKRLKCPKCKGAVSPDGLAPAPRANTPNTLAAATLIEDPVSARLPIATPSRGWRYLSSPWVVMTFIFGFLPWCEVGCSSKEINFRITQSGYQALYGGASAPPAVEELIARQAQQPNVSAGARELRQHMQKQIEVERSYLANVSPFLVFFWGADAALLALVCLVPLGTWRMGFAMTLCGLMLLMLILHACLGLPLERRVEQATVEAMRADPAQGLALLAAFSSGKTAWFWLTLVCVLLAALSEPLLAWLRPEVPPPAGAAWLLPAGITGAAAALAVAGSVVQFVAREFTVSGIEGRIAQLRKVEEEKQREAKRQAEEAAQAREAAIRQQEAVTERLREQRALEVEKARAAQQERFQLEYAEQKKRADERRQRAEEDARQRAEALARQQEEEAAREAARKQDLEKQGLAYYPRPKTRYNGKTAEQWSQLAISSPNSLLVQTKAAEALAALQAEGVPFLLDFLQKQTTPVGRDAVLRRIRVEYVHRNDLGKLVACLDRTRALPETRMVVLRLLHNRSADLRDHVGKIDMLVKDLLLNPVFKNEARSIMADLHKLAE
jgi:hypothetical protein